MYKLFVLAVTIGGFVFAGSWDSASITVGTSDQNNNQYCFVEDTSSDDFKAEARRRGKGHKGRRRGGSGLR